MRPHRRAYLAGACLVILTSWPGTAAETKSEKLSGAELVERSSAYHDPGNSFLENPHYLYFLEARPDGPDRRTHVLVDVAGERFEMERAGDHVIAGSMDGDECRMKLDGRAEVSEEEIEEHRLTCDRLRLLRNYYTYLWGLPMKLRDPGTRLGEVKETSFQDQPVFELRVTYEETVGGDIWYFYFDRESYALVGYRFYHDEAKNDGEVIYLEGETEGEGLRLPKSRTWFTHADNRELGTDHLLSISTHPADE